MKTTADDLDLDEHDDLGGVAVADVVAREKRHQ